MDLARFDWRKASDIDRVHPLFELVSGETILLDVGFSDSGSFEIAFHDGIANEVLIWEQLHELILTGKALAERQQ